MSHTTDRKKNCFFFVMLNGGVNNDFLVQPIPLGRGLLEHTPLLGWVASQSKWAARWLPLEFTGIFILSC